MHQGSGGGWPCRHMNMHGMHALHAGATVRVPLPCQHATSANAAGFWQHPDVHHTTPGVTAWTTCQCPRPHALPPCTHQNSVPAQQLWKRAGQRQRQLPIDIVWISNPTGQDHSPQSANVAAATARQRLCQDCCITACTAAHPVLCKPPTAVGQHSSGSHSCCSSRQGTGAGLVPSLGPGGTRVGGSAGAEPARRCCCAATRSSSLGCAAARAVASAAEHKYPARTIP